MGLQAAPDPDDVQASDQTWRLFSPLLEDSGATYAALTHAITSSPHPREALLTLARAGNTQYLDALRRRAAALVLHDLLALGWEVRVNDHFIEVRPPGGDGADGKASIRRQVEFARDDQLREPATRRFIIGLERPGRLSAMRPVTDLIADGRQLARRLAPIARLPRADRAAALAEVCQPYLQIVDAEATDHYTGLRLMDIWRYFRHSWATRYRSSPGRNLFYLIRDAAHPAHPVMAIAALGNAVMQLGTRDCHLGWTIDGLCNLIGQGTVTEREILIAFRARLEDDLSQIYGADLPLPASVSGPIDAEILDRLRVIEEQAIDSRTERLKDVDDEDAVPQRIDVLTNVDFEALARTPLFRAKRARAARDILRALFILRDAPSLAKLLSHEDGIWAINQVIRQLKKQFSATAIMEITVCGGVPPYTHLLGGKLACLMMLSPRVIRDYAERYDASTSIIASQMAGRPILKRPALVFLGTTSLYTAHSSQYNRVRIPAGTIPGQTIDVAFHEYGISKGYGSPNLSVETEAVLEALSERVRSYRNVNFVFGEGQSPKLRRLRESFDALGLRRTNMLHHASSRIVYGVPLASNCARFLLGVDREPAYSLPLTDDDAIANFWRTRWLASRLDHAPALAILEETTPLTTRVSRLLPTTPHSPQLDLFDAAPPYKERPMRQITKDDEKIAFLRNLYRDESAYSDDVRISRLRELNVKTKLDDVVRKVVRTGGSVVITGNAGDGKTHTIRLLESDLKEANAHVIVDASEHTQDHVLATWLAAREAGQPFCIAINEGPLIDLIRTSRADHPWLEEVRHDLLHLIQYVPVEAEVDDKFQPKQGKTVVIDLSLRRTLSPDLIRRIITKLTDETWYGGCTQCPGQATCPVTYNRTLLRETAVQGRLVTLLSRVAERGVRATFREVLAFGSYLVFGGKTCSELLADPRSEQSRYYWHAFEGQGAIFEQLQRGLDPLRQTSPKVDEQLWNGRFDPAPFLGHTAMPIALRDFDAVGQHEEALADIGFTALKRRWYFEHPEGKLSMDTQADVIFRELRDVSLTPQLRAGRLVALINAWWNPQDRDQQDRLRLWTRLAYSPRAQGKAMVSGRDVASLKLTLFKPVLTPALQAAFGETVIDHILFAPPENLRYAGLLVDRRLIETLLSHGVSDQDRAIERQLSQFNDALSRHADAGSHVRTIELLDPASDLQVRVRVDLSQRRYDSAQ